MCFYFPNAYLTASKIGVRARNAFASEMRQVCRLKRIYRWRCYNKIMDILKYFTNRASKESSVLLNTQQ